MNLRLIHRTTAQSKPNMPLFDETGIAPQCLALIYSVADKILDELFKDSKLDPARKTNTEIVALARESAAKMGDRFTVLEQRTVEIERQSPHLAPSASALIAMTSLADFAIALDAASDGDPADAVCAINDVVFDMLRHDHAKSFTTKYQSNLA